MCGGVSVAIGLDINLRVAQDHAQANPGECQRYESTKVRADHLRVSHDFRGFRYVGHLSDPDPNVGFSF
jgi:hypothetical protein